MLVRTIDGEAALRQVGRLRYERFVEERRCALPYADHENRLLLEPLDRTAVLLGGYCADELLGSARLNFGMPEGYRRLYGLAECRPEHHGRVSVTSRLVVSRRVRSLGRAALRLSQGCFDEAVARGVWLNFIDCNAPLRGFFRALGFVELGGAARDEVFGEVQPMVLVLPAADWFRRLRSPFHARAAAGFGTADLAAALGLLRMLAPRVDSAPLWAAAPAECGEGSPPAEPLPGADLTAPASPC